MTFGNAVTSRLLNTLSALMACYYNRRNCESVKERSVAPRNESTRECSRLFGKQSKMSERFTKDRSKHHGKSLPLTVFDWASASGPSSGQDCTFRAALRRILRQSS